MHRLLAERGPVRMEADQANEVFRWCVGRVGWVPFKEAGAGDRWPVENMHRTSQGGWD